MNNVFIYLNVAFGLSLVIDYRYLNVPLALRTGLSSVAMCSVLEQSIKNRKICDVLFVIWMEIQAKRGTLHMGRRH